MVRYFVLFVIDLETRRVEIAGIVGQLIPLGERHLRKAVEEYTEHHHLERNHQGLDNELIEKTSVEPDLDGVVEWRERLGGILKHYYRRAA